MITLAEPGAGFTKLRQESRARWNIETLVIGNDPFAFVEVIRRLEQGAIVALLIDRPPKYTGRGSGVVRQAVSASVAAGNWRERPVVCCCQFVCHEKAGLMPRVSSRKCRMTGHHCANATPGRN